MSFLDWLLKAVPQRAPIEEPRSPIYVMAGQPVRFLSFEAICTADVAQRKSPQLYRITNFVASAVQSVPWYAEADPNCIASERAGAAKIKAINDLLRSPNDVFTSQQLQYWIALNLMFYARAHFKVGIGATGNPNGIYPLAAKHVRGIINARGAVEGYEYGVSEETKTRYPTRRVAEKNSPPIPYAAEISIPSLTGLIEYNKAPAAIESLSIPIQIIAALMQRALDTAQGHPNVKYVITAEKVLTKAQKDALHKYLEAATPDDENSGNVLFLYNTDIKVHKLDNDMGDIHSKLPLDDMTRQIAGVFGVPVALLGLGSADAAKYASNYQESRLSFWQDTVVPCYLIPIAAGMTQAICPPGMRIMFDLDAVPALWDGRANLGATLGRVPFLLTNEKRAILGFDPTTEIPAFLPATVGAGAPVQSHPPLEAPPASEPRDSTASSVTVNETEHDNIIELGRRQ